MSPGRYPRFCTWEQLISHEGPQDSPMSSRTYLMEHIFDEESYNGYDLCVCLGCCSVVC